MSTSSEVTHSRIILTGATGYLGRRVLESLSKQGYGVTCLVRSQAALTDTDQVQFIDVAAQDWFTRVKPAGTLIHCATSYGRKGESPSEVSKSNIDFPAELLSYCSSWGVRTWINSHTSLPPDLNLYAKTKAEWLEVLKASSVPNKINLVLEQFFGPGEASTQFVTWLTRSLLTTRDEIPLTPGQQRRHFLYIDDLVRVFDESLKLQLSNGFSEFYVSSSEDVSIRELATMIALECHQDPKRLNFGAVAYRPNELMAAEPWRVLPAFPNWQPKIALSEGVRRVVEFEKQRLESLSKIQ